MSFTDQTITCQDCSETFVFTAAQAKEFDEKGYMNLPVRCMECRRNKLSNLRRRREGRAKAYTAPTPAPEIKNCDGVTKITGGFIDFDGKAKNANSADKNFGFIEYDGGNIYFPLDAFQGDASTLVIGAPVSFTCNKDEKGRLQANSVSIEAGKAHRAPKPEVPKTEAAPRASRERKERAPREKKEGDKAPRVRAPRAPKEVDPNAPPKAPREMINITVTGMGKESKTVQKPKERGTFGIFRRSIMQAYGKDLDRNFSLYHNNESLTYAAFNALPAGAVVEMRPGEEKKE